MPRETVHFKSVPNFRRLVPAAVPRQVCEDGRTKPGRPLNLYRSSRPDLLTAEELDKFLQLNVRSVIDLRSTFEYRKTDGPKLLDAIYPVYQVRLPASYHPDDEVTLVPVKPANKPTGDNGGYIKNDDRKHYLINFFRMNYMWAVFSRAPWYICLCSVLVMLLDFFLRNGGKYFMRMFARHVLNKTGLIGQYFDMLTYSQASICCALKLLSDPGNVPALINCAHGKDRTGVITALVLCCVGWSKDEIVADYAQSQIELEQSRHIIHEELVTRYHFCTSFVNSHADTMRTLLDYIEDRYGSVEEYLESIGFSRRDQLRLRQTLQSSDDED